LQKYKLEKERFCALLVEKRKQHVVEFDKAQLQQNRKIDVFQEQHQRTILEIQQKSYTNAEEGIGVTYL